MAEKNAKSREKFLSLFKIAFATGEASSRGDKSAIKKQEHDYEELKFFVNGLKKTDEIDACLDQYIRIYIDYFPSDRRSKLIFALLIEHRIDASKEDDKFIEDLSRILSDNQRPFRSAIRQRYEDLEDREKREIQAALKYKKERKKEHSTILDALRTAFYNANYKTATSADLLAFNPAPDKDLEKNFNTFRRNCDIPWSKKDAEGIEKALNEFMAFLYSQRDALKLFQIVKWGRDIVTGNTGKVVNKAGDLITVTTLPGDLLDRELYFQSVYWLFRYAIDHGYSRNYSGFSREEVAFFFEPLSSFDYYEIWLNRYIAGIKRADRFKDGSVLFLQLLIFARINKAILVNNQEALRIKNIRETTPEDVLRKKSFYLDVGSELFRGNIHIGARAGKVILIYFDQVKSSTSLDLYVEFVGLTNLLFKISKATWADFNDENFYTTLWMNTRHLLILIPAMLAFLGYTFSFITGGFSALIMDVSINIGVGEIAEAADLGPEATFLLQLGASVIVPGALRYAKVKYAGIGKPKVELEAFDQSLNRGLGGVADDARALKSVDNFVDAEARGVAQPGEPMVGDIITIPVLNVPGRITAIMPNGDMVVQPITRPPAPGGALTKTVQPVGSTAIEPFDPRARLGGGQGASGAVGTTPRALAGTLTPRIDERLTQGKENLLGVEKPQKDPEADETRAVRASAEEQPKAGSSVKKKLRRAAASASAVEEATSGKGTKNRGTDDRLGHQPASRRARKGAALPNLPTYETQIANTKAFKQLKLRGWKVTPNEATLRTKWGEFQIRITGGPNEYWGRLKDGTGVRLDGLAVSDTASGKLMGLEAKFGNPFLVDPAQSAHLTFWESKVGQLKNLAQFVKENSDIISHVEVVCSRGFVAETYLNMLIQQVPLSLREYLFVTWVD